jgi:hypothetical protein
MSITTQVGLSMRVSWKTFCVQTSTAISKRCENRNFAGGFCCDLSNFAFIATKCLSKVAEIATLEK